jgi:hypothetical protein
VHILSGAHAHGAWSSHAEDPRCQEDLRCQEAAAIRNARKAVSVRAVVVPEDLGAPEAVAVFLVEAQQIPASEILPMRADPALAHQNTLVGLDAVKSREAELAGLPAPFDLGAMKSLRPLSLGVVHAAAQVDRSSPGKTRKQIARAHELRDILLTSAEALSKAGVLPGPRVKRIAGARVYATRCRTAWTWRNSSASTPPRSRARPR